MTREDFNEVIDISFSKIFEKYGYADDLIKYKSDIVSAYASNNNDDDYLKILNKKDFKINENGNIITTKN